MQPLGYVLPKRYLHRERTTVHPRKLAFPSTGLKEPESAKRRSTGERELRIRIIICPDRQRGTSHLSLTRATTFSAPRLLETRSRKCEFLRMDCITQRVSALSRLILHGPGAARRGSEECSLAHGQVQKRFLPFQSLVWAKLLERSIALEFRNSVRLYKMKGSLAL